MAVNYYVRVHGKIAIHTPWRALVWCIYLPVCK